MATQIKQSGVTRRFLQEQVRLDFKGGDGTTKYAFIRCETVKPTHKQSAEKFTASESVDAYAVAFDGKENEIQLSGIDPNQRYIFNWIYSRQETNRQVKNMPSLTLYRYDDVTGKPVEDVKFNKVWIEELSKENNKPFDCKIGTLSADLNWKKP